MLRESQFRCNYAKIATVKPLNKETPKLIAVKLSILEMLAKYPMGGGGG